MFKDLLDINIKPDISKIEQIQEIKINADLKQELANLFYEEEKEFINVSDCTTIIKTDKNYVFFPNQYYYLAVICKDYAESLCEYCDFFDKKIRNSTELSSIVLNQNFENIKYNELFENNDDLKKFTRFLVDENYRPGKKFINGKEDKSFRGTKDIFGSCILKMLPLPDASSGYFGNIVYYLSKRKKLFSKLEKFYTESNVISPADNFKPEQTIYYGVPGCGKSHSISEKLRELGISKSDECNFTKRVVFHPEYTNADFIGQILPQTDDGKNVSYTFKAGPFTEILAQAYIHRNQNYALIIEEINRGNAAAIFGELFQLLDRLDKTENESSNGFTYTSGWSSYPVNNDNINKAIQEVYSKSDIDPFLPKEIFEKYKLNVGIRLPPNLSLLATMNTSDQNVFTLDNAFQRRWNMCLVPNVFSDTEEEKNQRTAMLEGSFVTWETFQTQINQKITQASKDSNFSSMVDKRLGCWFVKTEKNADDKFVITEDSFKNKILKYLWDDAFKFCREQYFVPVSTFEELQEKVKMSVPDFGVFKGIEFAQNTNEIEQNENEGSEENA